MSEITIDILLQQTRYSIVKVEHAQIGPLVALYTKTMKQKNTSCNAKSPEPR